MPEGNGGLPANSENAYHGPELGDLSEIPVDQRAHRRSQSQCTIGGIDHEKVHARDACRLLGGISCGTVFVRDGANQPAAGCGRRRTRSEQAVRWLLARLRSRATIFTFQSDIQVARHQYYRWRGNCYYRKPSGDFAPVAPGYCS